jgi:hypothetical protein
VPRSTLQFPFIEDAGSLLGTWPRQLSTITQLRTSHFVIGGALHIHTPIIRQCERILLRVSAWPSGSHLDIITTFNVAAIECQQHNEDEQGSPQRVQKGSPQRVQNGSPNFILGENVHGVADDAWAAVSGAE